MKVRKLVEIIREHATEPYTNARGNTVRRVNAEMDRYLVDFADDFHEEGWQQFDTDQDAAYFGVWMNKRQRLTLTYTEGDWTLVECPDREAYLREVADAIKFYGPGFVAVGIRDDGHKTTWRQDRAEFLN